jgi:hypothetical protein
MREVHRVEWMAGYQEDRAMIWHRPWRRDDWLPNIRVDRVVDDFRPTPLIRVGGGFQSYWGEPEYWG